MNQRLVDALGIVLDLAANNALDPEDRETVANDLVEEAEGQQAALALVEEFWNKIKEQS